MNKYDDVNVFVHDNSIYLVPHHVFAKDIDNWINDWRKQMINEAKRRNKDHFVYATKTFKKGEFEDKLTRVDLYYDVALDDTEFDKRVNAVYNEAEQNGEGVWFGVFHKGTAY